MAKLRRALVAIICMALLSSVSHAQQTKYGQTTGGWHIYKESKSCVMYFDMPSGTMVRISDRLDEGRIYFLAVNESWEELKPRENETFSGYLGFPRIKRGHGSASMVIKNSDGRMGFTMADIGRDEFLLHLAGEGELILSAMPEGKTKAEEIEKFYLSDSYQAVLQLTDCTRENF